MPDLSDKRIVVINNFGGPGMGGGEVQTLNVLRAGADAGLAVYLICPPGAALGIAAREIGVAVTEIDMRPTALPVTLTRASRRVTELEPHIVQGTGFLTNVLARRVAPARASVVNQVQVEPGASLADGGSRLGLAVRRRMDRRSRERVDAFVAVSRVIAEDLVAAGFPRDRVRVIHAATDPSRIREQAQSPLPAAFPDSRPVIGVVARLEPVKGVEHFVRAAAIVARQRDDVRFVVAGTGSLESKLREIAFAEGISERLTFLGDTRPAAPVLAACDLVVLPSMSEGLPVVALEAMALETPVVATRVGGIPEAVENGVTGILVPPADPAAMAEAILGLLGDSESMRQMAEKGPRRVGQYFTFEVMARAYRRLYEELLSSPTE